MNDSKRDRLGDLQEFELLEDLGLLARGKQARQEADEPGYRPLSPSRQAALVERVLGPVALLEPEVVSMEPEGAANDRGWPGRVFGYLASAAAAAAVTFMVSGEPPEPAPTRPPFGSWRIDGGGPMPGHLGAAKPSESVRVCPGRRMRLSLAVTPDQQVDRSQPLEVIVDATTTHGPSHRFLYEVKDGERFEWTDDGHAVVFEGALEELLLLTPGSWTLQPSIGVSGTCRSPVDRPGCTPLKVRTITVVSEASCDA
jgi:hypothetical protein